MTGSLDRLGVAVLRYLAKERPSDPMGEMAREVLSGRMTMPEAMSGAAYAEAFTVAAQEAVRTLDAMTPEELRELAASGEQAIDILDPPPDPPARPSRASVEDREELFTSPWDKRDYF
jgi:hypothetical protein